MTKPTMPDRDLVNSYTQCQHYSEHMYQDREEEYPDSPTSILSFSEYSPPHSPSPSINHYQHHLGTIYEAHLAPLSPSIILPIPSLCPPTPPSSSNHKDTKLQLQFNCLVSKEDPEQLDIFLTKCVDKVDINHYSKLGETALQRVCQESRASSLEMAKVLVKHGANTKLTTKDGWSPIHILSATGNSRLLLFLMRQMRTGQDKKDENGDLF